MSADSLAPEHERERQLDLVPKTPAETDLKVPAQPDEDAHDVETGDEPDMAAINRVYRYALLCAFKEARMTDFEQENRLQNHPALLDPVLPLRRDQEQHRAGADHEHQRGPRHGLRAQHDAAPDLHFPRPVLRLLRPVRFTEQPDHDAAKPARVDVPHRHERRAHRELSRCCKGRVGDVSASITPGHRHRGNVARHVVLSDPLLPPVPHRQENRNVLHGSPNLRRGRGPRVCGLPVHGRHERPGRLPVDVFDLWPRGHTHGHLAPMVAPRPASPSG